MAFKLRISDITGMEAKRSKIISLFESGKSAGEIFKMLGQENFSRKLIYRTIKRYKETGSFNDKARSGRPRTERTIGLKAKVQKRIVRNPRRSMRKMARDFGVSSRTIRRVVHDQLGLKSLKRRKVHMLTKSIREKRLQRSRILLSRAAESVVDKILFSDEKLFTIEEVTNSQNDRIVSTSVKDIPEEVRFIPKCQKPASVMVWGGISANSRTNLIFVPSGVKINSKTYRDLILETEVKSAGHKLFRNSNWIFQQDGAPAHTANVTQQWFRDKKIEFISKEEWPPSSPDLNPMDYSVWSILEEKACAKSHLNNDSLKASLQREWLKIPQDHFRRAVSQFRTRLQAVVTKKGGYIE